MWLSCAAKRGMPGMLSSRTTSCPLPSLEERGALRRGGGGGCLFLHQRLLGRRMQSQPGHALGIGLDDLELPAAAMLQALARFGHMAGEHEGEPAQRVDVAIDLDRKSVV